MSDRAGVRQAAEPLRLLQPAAQFLLHDSAQPPPHVLRPSGTSLGESIDVPRQHFLRRRLVDTPVSVRHHVDDDTAGGPSDRIHLDPAAR